MSKVLVDKELVSIVSEKVTETFDVNETEVSPSEGELDETVGGVVSVVVVVVVVLSVIFEPSSLLLLQEMTVKLKRNFSELGEHNIYHDSGVFYKNVGFYLDCV